IHSHESSLNIIARLTVNVVITRPVLDSLFPYTTLFRSHTNVGRGFSRSSWSRQPSPNGAPERAALRERDHRARRAALSGSPFGRSEEHTSELQSRVDLVCRLLPEKKKINIIGTLHGRRN